VIFDPERHEKTTAMPRELRDVMATALVKAD